MGMRVAVIKGGWSTEREVSLSSGREMAAALRSRDYDVVEIDAGRDLAQVLAALDPAPDVVLNALHGTGGEDGCVQGLLEILGLPHSHSGVLASAAAMDKPTSKRLFAAAGLPVVDHVITGRDDIAAGGVMAPPYVVKPTADGSSIGVEIIHDLADQQRLLARWAHGPTVMVERYVPGLEITVAVMGGRALEPIEVLSGNHPFYDYDSKYAPGGSEHLIPARLPDTDRARFKDLSERAYAALGCRGVARADFRFDPKSGTTALLEVNTQPGMTPTSLVPDAAAHAGMSYADLVVWMVEDARCTR